MHFLLSRYFAILGICVFLPWASSSVLDTTELSKTISPTEVLPNATIHSTVAPTTSDVTRTTSNATHTTEIPTTNNVTHTTVAPTTSDVTHTSSNVTHTTDAPSTSKVTHTTVAPTSSHAPVTSHSTVEPTGTTNHDATNVTDHVTTANGSTATFAPTANHTSVATTIVITTPSGGKSSQFDPASFLGGIVLMLGLSVIGFIAYRCYRNRRSSTPPYRVVDE